MDEKKNFRDYDQWQGIFRTITPNELLEPEHPARVVDAVVERLDLTSLYERYSEEGAPAYHPRMMLKVLFYSYVNGMMSCRSMWSGLKDRADYIFLSGDQVPDFRTINRFRQTVGSQLPRLFSQIVHLCAALGMVGFEHLAVDGEKIQANASFRKGMNKQRYAQSLARVEKGMQKLLSEEPPDDVSEQVRKKRMETLRKQRERLEQFAQQIEELEEDGYLNLTDPDAAQMKHKDGRSVPSYNHQSAVDGKYGITIATETRADAFDHSRHLLPLVDKATENAGGRFEKVMADSGFCDFEVLGEVQSRPERFYLPDRDFRKKTGKGGKYTQNAFTRTESGAVYCPAGLPMGSHGVNRTKAGVTVQVYRATACPTCPKKSKCTSGKVRSVAIDPRQEVRDTMRARLRTAEGRETYMKRQGIIEPVHGHDQKNLGWRQHHLRGIEKAHNELMLVRIGSNLKKMALYRADQVVLR